MLRLVAYAALAFLTVACPGTAVTSGPKRVSEPLPELSGVDLNGEPLSTSDFVGDVLVINVWASWCDPCEAEQPELVRVAAAYTDRGVSFLGIDHTDQNAAALAFVRRFGVPYPSLYDPEGRFSGDLGYFALPDTYVIDAAGTIRFVIAGATNEEELSGLLDELLGDA